MSFGAGLAGFTTGLANGVTLGKSIRGIIEDGQIANVRAQGIAEARAMQANATPKVQDLGDQQNLTSNPQASQDPNAAPAPVNTSLQQFQNNAQAAGDGGPGSMPVATPQVQDMNQLSSTPLASAAPGAQSAAPDAPSPFVNGLPQVARKRFNVDGQGFDTQEEAAAYVKKSTPPLASYFKDALIPKMTEALIAQGKPDQAAAWQKYADDADTHEHMKTWAKAVQLEQFGDHAGAAEQLMKLHPHYEDGIDLIKAVPTKGPDGSDGFTMTVRDKDGNEQQVYHDAESITRIGLAQLSPIAMFEQQYKQQVASETMQARESIDKRNDQRTAERQMANTKERDKAAEERQAARDKASAERADTAQKAKLAQAREGWAARAKLDADRLAKLGEFRKAVSPEERQAIVVSGLSKDPIFNMLSADEKKQRVEDTMALIPKPRAATGPAAPASGPTMPNPGLDPKLQGIPASPEVPAVASPTVPPPSPAAPAGKKAVTVYDPATQSMRVVYR